MENLIKCSSKDHLEIDSIIYCQKCEIYMCKKCEIIHTSLCPNHLQFILDKNIKDSFTGLCKEKNHPNKLNYFCKTHNQLCCAACISKIKDKENGQHSNCEIFTIENIKDEKKNKLKENLNCLEELSKKLEESIKELKELFEKINKSKEELKLKIQSIFTKIRNALNDREDELLLDVDNQFNKLFGDENIIKESEKLPKKIVSSLEKGKIIEKEWNDNNINSLINDCINVENNIQDINIINENIKKCNKNSNNKIEFYPNENSINTFLETIKSLGRIYYKNFRFKKCPMNINDVRKYSITGEHENIFTKTGSNGWMATICDFKFEKTIEYKWKIKIINSLNKSIMVGIAPFEFDINTSLYHNCGWYYYLYDSTLYSGPPHKYSCKASNLSKVQNEIIIIMNMNKGTLKFIINNEDKGESYSNIPLDKPLTPAVFLYHQNDSIEIIEC